MVLLLPAVYAAEVSEDGSADRASTAASESSSADIASAAETLQAQKENAEKKDILILFTSDVHCGIDKGFGYAGLEQIRKHEQDKRNEVILVDNGDNIQGDAMGLLTKGEALLDLMNKMGYSVAIPGNHEFDYGMDNFLSLAKKAQFKYISCNFQYRG
jgi:2',3'-cyclic-nucleotide 2'-phosphodiesterase (5'-nucleotidase family)